MSDDLEKDARTGAELCRELLGVVATYINDDTRISTTVGAVVVAALNVAHSVGIEKQEFLRAVVITTDRFYKDREEESSEDSE